MINYNTESLGKIAVHHVGSKSMEEGVVYSSGQIVLEESFLKDVLLQYFLNPFKQQLFYNFHHENHISLNPLYNIIGSLFEDSELFFEKSKEIASLLYENSDHARIKPGEFYMVGFNNIELNGESVNAFGLFKSENKDTFLKVMPKSGGFDIKHDTGININKLDKGCIIFNLNEGEGYKMLIIDNASKGEEARFWKDDFLKVKQVEDEAFRTRQYMNLCKNFCEEVLTEENNISKKDQVTVKNRTAEYFKANDRFNANDFAEEIMEAPEIIESFNEYKENFFKKKGFQMEDEFDISSPVVAKESKKFTKSVLKLDKNFHVYVHGSSDFLEKGFDEEKNMNYYRLFFSKES